MPVWLLTLSAALVLVCIIDTSSVFADVSVADFNTNGTFEGSSINGVPNGWELVTSNSAVNLVPSISTASPHSGSKCLKLTCSYASVSQVYGLVRANLSCEPSKKYKFTLYIKSDSNDGYCWFGGGKEWRWINTIPMGTYGWTSFEATYTTGSDETSVPFFILAAGNATIYIDDVYVECLGTSESPTILPTYTAWSTSQLQSAFSNIQTQTAALDTQLQALKTAGANTDYAQIKLSMIKAFIPNVNNKITNSDYALACTVMLDEMNQLVSALQSDITALTDDPKCVPAAYRYRTGTITPSGFSQVADVYDPTTKQVVSRPAILNGFGHFNTVADDIPDWQNRGCNLIQIEQGPDCVYSSNGTLYVNVGPINDVVEKLQSAAANNVSVILLISPHYLPSSAGAPWWSDDTTVWAYYKAYLAKLLPKIKDIPSLQSITLSNEPASYPVPDDTLLQSTWLQYITNKYSNIASLNAAYGGTSYDSFSNVPIPPNDKLLPSNYTHNERPWIYDWERCNETRFASWHKRMADLVHQYAPNIKVQSKVAGGLIAGLQANGVDPEMFASLTDYCGFDQVGGLSIIYDLDPSFQTAPTVNSENHLINPDINYDMVDNSEIYADIFIQAMHGQTASAAWTYEPNSSDTEQTTFAIRPAGMEAVARCGMDLMRVAPAIAAIQETPREVAIIYSPASQWYDDSHRSMWVSTWNAFFNTGLRVRFLSEKQLQAGQFGNVKVLILPETQVIEPETISAISSFVAAGGKVISLGHVMEYSTGWTPISSSVVDPLIWKRIDTLSIGWEKQVISWIKQAGVTPDVTLASSSNPNLNGIHWLSGTYNGKKVVSIVNTSGDSADISISSPGVIRAHELITDKDIQLPITLPNYSAVVIQITQESPQVTIPVTLVNPGFDEVYTDSTMTTLLNLNVHGNLTVGLGSTSAGDGTAAYTPGWVSPATWNCIIDAPTTDMLPNGGYSGYVGLGLSGWMAQLIPSFTIQPGKYVLTAKVGGRADYHPGSAIMRLLANQTTVWPDLSDDYVLYAPSIPWGSFVQWKSTYNVTSDNANIGEPLIIHFTIVGDQVLFDDVSLDFTPATQQSILGLKTTVDNSVVYIIEPKIVTVSSGTFSDGSFYIEEPSRVSGIKIVPKSGLASVNVGDRIVLSGEMATDANGEKIINASNIDIVEAGSPLGALGMPNKAVVAQWPDVSGLYVSIWGKVTVRNNSGGSDAWFYIDDGSGIQDGSGYTGIKCSGDSNCTTPNCGDYVKVTGIMSIQKNSSNTIRFCKTLLWTAYN